MPDQDVAKRAQTLLVRGAALYRDGKLYEALACWKRVLQLDPGNTGAKDYLRFIEDNFQIGVDAFIAEHARQEPGDTPTPDNSDPVTEFSRRETSVSEGLSAASNVDRSLVPRRNSEVATVDERPPSPATASWGAREGVEAPSANKGAEAPQEDAGEDAEPEPPPKHVVKHTGPKGCKSNCGGNVTPALNNALAVRARGAKSCYEKALRTNSTLAGKLVVEVKVAPSGAICSSKVIDDELGDASVGSCARRRLTSKTLPKPDGGCVDVKVPLNFKPSQ